MGFHFRWPSLITAAAFCIQRDSGGNNLPLGKAGNEWTGRVPVTIPKECFLTISKNILNRRIDLIS